MFLWILRTPKSETKQDKRERKSCMWSYCISFSFIVIDIKGVQWQINGLCQLKMFRSLVSK